MEVILLKDVEKVGLRGEVVNVARGYARNFLLPRRLAEPATPGRVAELRAAREPAGAPRGRAPSSRRTRSPTCCSKTVLSFDVKSGPTGALFGSVTTTDIADELWRTHKIRVDRRKIDTDSIKRIGRYSIPVQVFEDVSVEVKTLVVPEGGELPPEEELAAMEAAEAEAAGGGRGRGRARTAPRPRRCCEADARGRGRAEAEAEPRPDDAEARRRRSRRPSREPRRARRPTAPSAEPGRIRAGVVSQHAPQACGARGTSR